jgi:hypothetical protein
MTPQERKSFKNKNNNSFKDEKKKNFKQIILNRTILMSVSGVGLQCSW